jgi:ABC-type multidrug transport system fused ATPase/permease subunit
LAAEKMISLLGTLLGFGTSIVPEILGYFKQKQANQQELAMLEAKAKYAEKLSELKLKELDAQADIVETQSIYSHDNNIDSGSFVNALRGSVRPVITYAFFVLFAAIKTTALMTMMSNDGVDLSVALVAIWDDETQAIFSAIIAFWFGNRAMSKARARVGK